MIDMVGTYDVSELIVEKVKEEDEPEWLKELSLELVNHERSHDTTGREGYFSRFNELAEEYIDEGSE